jgi:hypothetical protein
MPKNLQTLSLILVCVIGGAAAAQTKPLRVDGGIQTAPQSSWTGTTGVGGLYYQTGVGLVMRKTDNTEVTLGAGGGAASTLASSYSAGTSGASSTITYDSTRSFLKILDAPTSLNVLFQLRNNADSLTYVSLTSNSQHFFRSGAVDGPAAVGFAVDTNAAWSNATSKPFRVLSGGIERFSVTGPGNLNLVANASIVGASSATNTNALSITTNVADGSTSVGLRINNSTTLATGALLQLANAGTTLLSITPVATSGVRLTGGSAWLSIDSTNGSLLGYGSNYLFVGVSSITANGLPLVSDGISTLGTSSTPWPVAWAKFHGVTLGSPLTSATTITPTSALHHVTGTVSVTTIATTNLPSTFAGSLTIICDAACVFATGGNISTGFTGAVNKAYVFWWDGTAWRVQGGG